MKKRKAHEIMYFFVCSGVVFCFVLFFLLFFVVIFVCLFVHLVQCCSGSIRNDRT